MEGVQIGPYRVLGDLGSGGMGKVYLAEVAGQVPGLDEGCRVALKVIHPHLLETPGFFKRFLREAQLGQQVAHENVVRTHGCDATLMDGANQHYLVMEYVEGQTLRELLVEMERVPEELCRHIGREVAKGLAAIHGAGAVHRDLKPENVLITADHVVKVMDLGVAWLQDEAARLSQTGAFVGSLEYAAPEQFRSTDGEPDGRTDLHALGVVLYELSTGQHPYRDEDASRVIGRILNDETRKAGEVNPQLSPFFEEAVHTLIAKDPEERFDAARDLALILQEGEESVWWTARAKALRIQTKRPLRRIRIPRETALYGRDADLAKLHALYEKAKAGDGHVLLIEGEAGIGKTRLVDEFVGRLQQEGEDVNFLFGSYPPGGAATASGAFSTAYREQFGSETLEQTLTDYLAETPLLIPAFAALLGGDATPTGVERLTKDSLQTVFVHATRGLAVERTTIVLIDDLHFAPEEGRALFASLTMALPGHRVLLMGTSRPGIAEDWVANLERTGHLSSISLSRLGPKDLTKLLMDAFKSERLAQELGFQIAQKSDGNPYFAFEIIRGLREGQFITQKPDGTWASTQVVGQIEFPSSVIGLIQARIAGLSEEEKDLLDVASCLGLQFDPLLVGEVVGMAHVPLLKRLGRIEKTHRLVRSAGHHCVFDHHQVQQALYAGLSDLLREAYHGAIAEALETREGAAEADPKDLDGALCVELCEHYLKGARGGSAVRYLDEALNHLKAGYLNDRAIALADRALAVKDLVTGGDRVDLLLEKAGRLGTLGRRQEHRAALDAALPLAEELGLPGPLVRTRAALGSHLLDLACYDEAREVLELALEGARSAGDPKLEARTTGLLGSVFLDQGLFAKAHEHHERHLALAREIGDRTGEASATGNLGGVYWYEGRYAEAREQFERVLVLFRDLGDRRGEAAATGNLGLVIASEGRSEEARAHYERHLALCREIGARRGEAAATGNLGNAFWSQGRFEQAREQYEHCVGLCREIGNRRGEAIVLADLGVLLASLGALEEGREQLRASRDLCREIGARREEGHALESLASLADELGKLPDAEQPYHEALELWRELGYRAGVGSMLARLGALRARQGRTDEAIAHLTEAREIARDDGTSDSLVLAVCHLALLPGGDVQAALTAHSECADRLEPHSRMDARYLLWQATKELAHLREAKRILDHLVEHAPEEYRESMLKKVRLHREVMEAWKEHGGPA